MRAVIARLFVIMGWLLACSCTAGAAASAPAWMKDRHALPSLEGTRVLFVAGYLNELIPGYFDDNVAVVEALGAKADRLFPQSEESEQDDAAAVLRWVDAQPGPVWLLGHSKGGAAVLLAALKQPRLVLDGKVRAVLVVQGAVRGSPVADLYAHDLVLGKRGMKALTQAESDAVFNRALEEVRRALTPTEQGALFSRLFYVRSRIETAAVAAELGPTHNLLNAYGPNDGLLLADAMRLDVGVDLGVLDSDHAGLVLSSFLTSSTPARRREFARALCCEVSRRLALLPGG
jgi:dienelactone hydrolase